MKLIATTSKQKLTYLIENDSWSNYDSATLSTMDTNKDVRERIIISNTVPGQNNKKLYVEWFGIEPDTSLTEPIEFGERRAFRWAELEVLQILSDDSSHEFYITAWTNDINGNLIEPFYSLELLWLIGKPSWINADFTTAYASATTIDCTSLPSYASSLTADDIISIVQINTSWEVVKTYTRDDAPITVSWNTITVSWANFVDTDSFVVYTNIPRVTTTSATVTWSGWVGGGNNTYSTMQQDFTATVTDWTNDIVLSVDSIGGISIDESIIQSWILEVYDASANTSIKISLDWFTWTSGTKTINTTNCTNAFTFNTGDLVSLTLIWPDKGYDTNLDIFKNQEQSPLWNRYTDVSNLLWWTPYELTASFVDVGEEIDVRGYSYITLWFTIDIWTSTNPQIRILHKHTSDWTEEYREIYLWSPASNITTINLNDYEIASDTDQLFKITMAIKWSRYIQIQAKDDANGDWQIDSLYYTLDY